MKIHSVEAIPLDIGFSRTFRFGTVDRNRSQNVVVRVTTDDGITGYGEACPVSAFTRETQESIVAKIEDPVAEFLVGSDAFEREPIIRTLESHLVRHPFTLSAIDMALWDVAGKALGHPVWSLLGGRFRGRIDIHGSVGIASTEEMVENAVTQVDNGYRSLKLYAGRGTLSDDISHIKAVREAVGANIDFILDVNQLWNVGRCLEALPQLHELGVVLLEQPISAEDEQGQARVVEHSPISIAADEAVFTSIDVARIGSMKAAHALNLGLSKLGGLLRARECSIVARAHGIQLMVGSVLELAIATAAGLHLAASLPDLPFPNYLLGPVKYERQITERPFIVDNGVVDVPTGPGLGIEPDMELIRSIDMRNQ